MKEKILFAVSLLLGLMMLNSGFNKFLHYMQMPEMSEAAGQLMGAFAESGWLFPLVAIAEIVGGVLLILKKYRALGAIILFPIIVGILVFHLVQDPGGIGISIILMAVNLWIIYENKDKYMPMIQG